MDFTLCHRKDLFKNLESLSRIISVKGFILIAWTWIGLDRNKLIFANYQLKCLMIVDQHACVDFHLTCLAWLLCRATRSWTRTRRTRRRRSWLRRRSADLEHLVGQAQQYWHSLLPGLQAPRTLQPHRTFTFSCCPVFFRNLFFFPRFLQPVLFFKLLQLSDATLFLVPDFLSGFFVNIFFNRFLDPVQYAFTFLPALSIS